MKTIWSDKTVLDLKVISIILVLFYTVVVGILYMVDLTVKSLKEPREISLAHNLPNSASDVHEKTDYLRLPPDEEYRYYLKAKITKEEFLEFTEDLELEWASPINRSLIPYRNPSIPWWDPPSNSFLYATGNHMDYCMQADYVKSSGYVYLYIEQN